MKQCSYCGTRAEDSVTTCSACGASCFSNICPNCGNVYENGGFCPNCGTSAKARPKTCPRCGNVYFTNACPNCGYTSAGNGFGTQQTQSSAPQYSQTTGSYAPAKKGSGCWKIILWILFLPIMAIISIWKSPRMGVLVKILLTLLVLGICVALNESTPPAASGSTGLDAPLITATSAPVAQAPSLGSVNQETPLNDIPAVDPGTEAEESNVSEPSLS